MLPGAVRHLPTPPALHHVALRAALVAALVLGIALMVPVLQLALCGAPAECPHDLAQLHRGDGAAAVPAHTTQVKPSTSMQKMSYLKPNDVKNVIHKVS